MAGEEYDATYFTDADELGKVEPRPRGSSVARAHELLDFWLKKATGAWWPQLTKPEVSAGLHARITNPNLIAQISTGLCGPASFARAVAWDDPCEYALLGGLLYEGGWANLGRRGGKVTRIQPGQALRTAVVSPGMDQADWLVLASLRDSFNNVMDYHHDLLEGLRAMSVGSVLDFFRAAGYSEVVDGIGGGGAVSQGIDSIEKANDYFRRGYVVLLLIHTDMLTHDTSIRFPTANHWITLNSEVEVSSFSNFTKLPYGKTGVRIDRIWTWGEQGYRSVPKTKDSPAYMPLEDFIECYYGYVAARAEL